MKNRQLLDIMGNIDDKFISEAAPKERAIKKILYAAACVVLCIAIAGASVPIIKRAVDSDKNIVYLGGIKREYNKIGKSVSEAFREWPWEYKTVYEKYAVVQFGGREYTSAGNTIGENQLEKKMGTSFAIGYNELKDEKINRSAEIYKMKGIDEKILIAVKLQNSFYVYKNLNDKFEFENFGDLINAVSLRENLNLGYFTLVENDVNRGNYHLKSDEKLWDILYECVGAKAIKDEDGDKIGRARYIEFSATSDSLSCYKSYFSVGENGYVKSNFLDWNYSFYIGEKRAKEIIGYVMNNCEESEEIPYEYILIGTVKEVKGGKAVINDGALMANPKKGMDFILSLDDIRVSRYFDLEHIKKDDLIAVSYRGGIKNQNIMEPVRISKAFIYDEKAEKEE